MGQQDKIERPDKDDGNRLSPDAHPFAVITLGWIRDERRDVQIRKGENLLPGKRKVCGFSQTQSL